MKKTKVLLTLLAFLAISLSACNGKAPSTPSEGDESQINPGTSENVQPSSEDKPSSKPEEHTHSWDTKWSSDESYHWRKCTGQVNGAACQEVNDKAAHQWDSGTVTKEPGEYTEGLKVFKCTICNYSKNEVIPATGPAPMDEGVFTFNDSELNTPQVIHTNDQKNFLNYNKPYYQITGSELDGFNARGNSNVSTPNKVTVKWTHTVPSGKTVKNYSLIYGTKEDLSDGYEVTGTTSSQISFYNPYLGDNYFKVVANYTDNSKEASETKIFKVDAQCPRNLSVGNMPNCRDMGGRTTYAGGKIRQGLIYRTSGSKFDNRTESNNEAKSVLLNQLKVKTEINVANSTTNNVNLSGTNVVNAYMDYGATPYSNLARNAEKVKQVIDVLADRANYPVYYHCRIGTDRTGITGVMVGGLLGIKFNEVIQDYLFSNFAPIDNQRYPGKTPDNNGDDIKKYIDELLAMPGNTFQEQVYNAFLCMGVSASKLNTVIDIMTEGNKADIPTTPKVGYGDALASTGTKSTASDYSAPSVYYVADAGKTVSYTASFTAGKKDIIIYLGSTDASTSTYLKNCITLKIDGESASIANTKTLHTAGFGSTQQNHRTGYMINMLGQYDLTAGNHTIEIGVKSSSSTTFNIASIGVFDYVRPAE